MTSEAQTDGTANGRFAPGSRMLADAHEAPQAVARLIAGNADLCSDLARRLRDKPPTFAVTCARGSSDSAATFAKYLLEIKLGIVTASVGPSVSSIYGARPRMKDALFLAISQSGQSPDLLSLTRSAREDGALTVAIVNDEASPLANLSEIVLPLRAGPERSVAATKSYIASLAAILQLAATWSRDAAMIDAVGRLPEELTAAVSRDWSAAISLLEQTASLYVIGRGPGLAIAQEMALKFKETCGLHAEAISAAELMHGPLVLAGRFPVLVLCQNDDSLPGIRDLVGVLTGRGAPVIVAGREAMPGAALLTTAKDVAEFAEPIAIVQSFYPFVARLARARGHDPDRPPNLVKVTETI